MTFHPNVSWGFAAALLNYHLRPREEFLRSTFFGRLIPNGTEFKTWLVQAIEHYAHASWSSPNNVAVLAEATVEPTAR